MALIESKGFYELFSALKNKLDQQSTSHHTAFEFLHTLKTLMAKLKVFSLFSYLGGLLISNRQTTGELCQVRSLFLTFVLALNLDCRNHGRASCELSPCDLV